MNDPLPAAKPPKLKRGLLWGLGAVFGLTALVALFDPNAGKAPPPDPNQINASKVADLREAMKPIGRSIFNHAIAIPPGARAIDLQAASVATCADKSICSVWGWTDPAQVPHAQPLLAREVAAMSFRYDINRNTGFEQTIWYCGSPGAKPDCVKPGVE